MKNRTISENDVRIYLRIAKQMEDSEATLYEAGEQLDQEALKIDKLTEEQNRIRFDENENDLFSAQMEDVIRFLGKSFGQDDFENNLYFNLVYNLMLLEYDRFDKIDKEEPIARMVKAVGVTTDIKNKVKELLDHEVEMEARLREKGIPFGTEEV
jgi:hypothetical protein